MGRKFYSNAGFLLVLQVSSYIFPLLLIPYLTRVLGVSLYGVVAFALATSQLLCIITDFGFNLSATRQIAESHGDKKKIRAIVASVFASKVLLLIPVLIILLIFICSQQEKYGEYSTLFWLLLLPVIGQTFQPIWLFQGIERMAFITIFVVIARALYILLVITLVVSAQDLNWVVLSNGVSQIVAAIISLFFMYRLGYSPLWPGWSFVKSVFIESVQFFWSRLAVSTYTLGGVFYLGLFATPSAVAFYSAAEQLYRAGQALFQPVVQSLYPYMARTKDLNFFTKIMKGAVAFSMLGLVFTYFTGEWFLVKIFGVEFSESYYVLMIFVLAFCVVVPSSLLGYPLLGVFDKSDFANGSVLVGGVVQLLLLFTLWVLSWNYILMVAATVLITECLVFLIRYYRVRSFL